MLQFFRGFSCFSNSKRTNPTAHRGPASTPLPWAGSGHWGQASRASGFVPKQSDEGLCPSWAERSTGTGPAQCHLILPRAPCHPRVSSGCACAQSEAVSSSDVTLLRQGSTGLTFLAGTRRASSSIRGPPVCSVRPGVWPLSSQAFLTQVPVPACPSGPSPVRG